MKYWLYRKKQVDLNKTFTFSCYYVLLANGCDSNFYG